VGELYRNVFMRTQNRMPEDIPQRGRERERHPAPIHLILTQDAQLPRSIQLSVRFEMENKLKNKATSPRQNSEPFMGSASPNISDHNNDPSMSSYIRVEPSLWTTPSESDLRKPQSICRKAPRLAFAVRLSDTFRPDEDIGNLFLEWLREIPTIAEEVTIEAGFDSFSTLLVLSLPLSLSAYLPRNPAVISLGPIASGNRIFSPEVAHHLCDISLKQRVEPTPSGVSKLDPLLPVSKSHPLLPALSSPPSQITRKEQNADATPNIRRSPTSQRKFLPLTGESNRHPVDKNFLDSTERFREDFRRNVRRVTAESYESDSSYESDTSLTIEKRTWAGRPGSYADNDDTSKSPLLHFEYLTIGDEVEVKKYYVQRFRDIGQSLCKVLGKAFIKLVEPKKQTLYPYLKGDSSAPPWWPISGDNSVRHKEPDHLLKPGKLFLKKIIL
jgi:hypothetical protein